MIEGLGKRDNKRTRASTRRSSEAVLVDAWPHWLQGSETKRMVYARQLRRETTPAAHMQITSRVELCTGESRTLGDMHARACSSANSFAISTTPAFLCVGRVGSRHSLAQGSISKYCLDWSVSYDTALHCSMW